MTIICKINGIPGDYHKLPFGRQLDYLRAIEAFKASAKSTHLSQKCRSYKAAIKEFVKLNGVTEYYAKFQAGKDVYDDSFEFFYKVS